MPSWLSLHSGQDSHAIQLRGAELLHILHEIRPAPGARYRRTQALRTGMPSEQLHELLTRADSKAQWDWKPWPGGLPKLRPGPIWQPSQILHSDCEACVVGSNGIVQSAQPSQDAQHRM